MTRASRLERPDRSLPAPLGYRWAEAFRGCLGGRAVGGSAFSVRPRAEPLGTETPANRGKNLAPNTPSGASVSGEAPRARAGERQGAQRCPARPGGEGTRQAIRGKRDGARRATGREWPHRTAKTFKTKAAEANAWISDQEARFNSGTYVDPRRGQVLFSTVATEWLATKAGIEHRTRADYQRDLDRFPFADKKIRSVTAGAIEDWLSGLLSDGRSHRTMVKTYGPIAQVLKFAARRGYIAQNPCLNVTLPARRNPAYDPDTGDFIEEQPEPVTILERDEITKLADAMPNPTYRLAVLFDAWMGLRASELWALQRRDINLLTGQVYVRRAWKERRGGGVDSGEPPFYLGPLKTKAGRRDIHMPEFLRAQVEAHLSEHGAPLLGVPATGWRTRSPAQLLQADLQARRREGPAAAQASPALSRPTAHSRESGPGEPREPVPCDAETRPRNDGHDDADLRSPRR